MDTFFWLETILPILITGLFSVLLTSLFRRLQKRGYIWGFFLVIFFFLLLVVAWAVVGNYSNDIQCKAAYGDLASQDPKVCDNPAGGIALILQSPFLIVGWISISVFTLLRLKTLPSKSAAT